MVFVQLAGSCGEFFQPLHIAFDLALQILLRAQRKLATLLGLGLAGLLCKLVVIDLFLL